MQESETSVFEIESHYRGHIVLSHVSETELGTPPGPTLPGNGEFLGSEALHESSQGHFEGQVEVPRVVGSADLDDLSSVGFEGVGQVIERQVEAGTDEAIDDAIDA